MAKDPLLLLDNSMLAYILGNGDYRFTNIAFEEAKAIMEMKGTADIVRVFSNPELEHIMFEYLPLFQPNHMLAINIKVLYLLSLLPILT